MSGAGRDGIVVCAMGKDIYLELAGRWIERLRAAGRRVADLRANVVDRAGLLDALDFGPGLVLYAGHGRSRGWAGYQTVRWEHLAARPAGRAAGVIVALACDTLTPGARAVSFGERLVSEGRARAYVGAAASLRIPDGAALGDRLVAELAGGRATDAQGLLEALAQTIDREGDVAAARALATLRLVGDPTARLPAASALDAFSISADRSASACGGAVHEQAPFNSSRHTSTQEA